MKGRRLWLERLLEDPNAPLIGKCPVCERRDVVLVWRTVVPGRAKQASCVDRQACAAVAQGRLAKALRGDRP